MRFHGQEKSSSILLLVRFRSNMMHDSRIKEGCFDAVACFPAPPAFSRNHLGEGPSPPSLIPHIAHYKISSGKPPIKKKEMTNGPETRRRATA
jgi:hypothetical protein